MKQLETNFYLNRYQFSEQEISSLPQEGLNLVVVIPSFKEPQLLASLQSLLACVFPQKPTEVIVMINCSEKAEDIVRQENQSSWFRMISC